MKRRTINQKKYPVDEVRTFTVYIVRDDNSRRYLNRRVYSGRVRGIWGRRDDAVVFYTAAQARSSAGNINRRRPAGYSAFRAGIRTVKMLVRGKNAEYFIELMTALAAESRRGKKACEDAVV